MNTQLQEICIMLDDISDTILNATSDDRTFNLQNNWQFPPVNRHLLSNIPKSISDKIKQNGILELDEEVEENLENVKATLGQLKKQTIEMMFNGNGREAIPAYINSMVAVNTVFDPLTNWQVLLDAKAMPAPLARRLRSIEAQINDIMPNKNDLENRIKRINDATEAAENLPTDMQSLQAKRKEVADISTSSAVLLKEIQDYHEQAEKTAKAMAGQNAEAEKIVRQCEESYRITTSVGLAAAFDERAKSSSYSMWIWVFGLLLALFIGAQIGSIRLNTLTEYLNSGKPDWGVIWMHISLSILSIGAPLWFAWLSTKQINQRFRLSEDYAFKASVAKAYEGYRKEAARIDESFEARLFSSALTRLEEAPIRLMETDMHSSPYQEFFNSPAFTSALDNAPGLREAFKGMYKDGISIFKSNSHLKKTGDNE